MTTPQFPEEPFVIPRTGFLSQIQLNLRPTGGWPVNNNDERDYEEEEANRRLMEETDEDEYDDDGDDDEPADGESFDGGFGPGSYFSRAMAKDD